MSSTAIAASSMAIAASAQHAADVAVCKQIISSFNPDGASVAAIQAYAKCVEMIYPEDMSDGFRLFLKISIVCAIVGAVFGFVWVKRDRYDTVTASFMSVFGACAGGLLPLLAIGAVKAVGFLFS